MREDRLDDTVADNGVGVKSAAERAENDKPVVPPTTPPKTEGRGSEEGALSRSQLPSPASSGRATDCGSPDGSEFRAEVICPINAAKRDLHA